MNNLDFIVLKIAYYKDMYERRLVALDLIEKDSIGEKKLKDEVSFCEERLKHLKQIKDILEAWEVCKSDNSILYVLQTLARGEAIDWHRLPEKQQEILKKAL